MDPCWDTQKFVRYGMTGSTTQPLATVGWSDTQQSQWFFEKKLCGSFRFPINQSIYIMLYPFSPKKMIIKKLETRWWNHVKNPEISQSNLLFENPKQFSMSPSLVGGLEPWNFMTFHSVGNRIIIPFDELIFFRGVGQPPTRRWPA